MRKNNVISIVVAAITLGVAATLIYRSTQRAVVYLDVKPSDFPKGASTSRAASAAIAKAVMRAAYGEMANSAPEALAAQLLPKAKVEFEGFSSADVNANNAWLVSSGMGVPTVVPPEPRTADWLEYYARDRKPFAAATVDWSKAKFQVVRKDGTKFEGDDAATEATVYLHPTLWNKVNSSRQGIEVLVTVPFTFPANTPKLASPDALFTVRYYSGPETNDVWTVTQIGTSQVKYLPSVHAPYYFPRFSQGGHIDGVKPLPPPRPQHPNFPPPKGFGAPATKP